MDLTPARIVVTVDVLAVDGDVTGARARAERFARRLATRLAGTTRWDEATIARSVRAAAVEEW